MAAFGGWRRSWRWRGYWPEGLLCLVSAGFWGCCGWFVVGSGWVVGVTDRPGSSGNSFAAFGGLWGAVSVVLSVLAGFRLVYWLCAVGWVLGWCGCSVGCGERRCVLPARVGQPGL